MRLLPLLTALIMATAGYAQSTSTTTTESTWSQLRASPLNLSYVLWGASVRDDNSDLQGANLYHDFAFSYDVSANDQFRIMHSLKNSVGTAGPPLSDNLMEFRYLRKNLMTQAENGMDMSFQVRYQAHGEGARASGLGRTSARIGLNRTMSDQFSWNNEIRYDHYHSAGRFAFEGETNNLYVHSLPTWSFSDALSGGVMLTYARRDSSGSDEVANELWLSPFASYKLNDTYSLDAFTYFTTLRNGALVEIEDEAAMEVLFTAHVF